MSYRYPTTVKRQRSPQGWSGGTSTVRPSRSSVTRDLAGQPARRPPLRHAEVEQVLLHLPGVPTSGANSSRTQTWQVAQEPLPPHSPTMPGTPFLTAAAMTDSPTAASTACSCALGVDVDHLRHGLVSSPRSGELRLAKGHRSFGLSIRPECCRQATARRRPALRRRGGRSLHDTDPAAPRRQRLEREEPVHGLGGRRPHTTSARSRRGRSGAMLRDAGLLPAALHTSVLTRAVRTGAIDAAGRRPGRSSRPGRHWRLNERCYGALQGRDRRAVRAEYGEEQFRCGAGRTTGRLRRCRRAANGTSRPTRATPASLLPRTESLADVVARLLPYWTDVIVPDLREHGTVLVVGTQQLAARPRRAPRPALPRGGARPEHPDRDAAAATTSAAT